MIKLPAAMEKVTGTLAPAFTRPAHTRICMLLTAAIITVRSRTISKILRTVSGLIPGHCSACHRILSRARFWHWRVGRILATLVIEAFCAEGPIYLAGDDIVDEHRGAKVLGKGCHRDAVRSSHGFTAYLWGHKWVVLAVLVCLPWSKRPWALPVMEALRLMTLLISPGIIIGN